MTREEIIMIVHWSSVRFLIPGYWKAHEQHIPILCTCGFPYLLCACTSLSRRPAVYWLGEWACHSLVLLKEYCAGTSKNLFVMSLPTGDGKACEMGLGRLGREEGKPTD